VTDITAIVVGDTTPAVPPGASAVTGVQRLDAITDAAHKSASPLLWILDASATPGEGTLQELIAVGRRPACSVPVDSAGRPQETWIGTISDADVPALLLSIREHLVPLRFTPLLSLLVDREAVLEEPGPAESLGPYAALEWTARLFARHPAVLVPRSTVEVRDRAYPLDLPGLARVARNPHLRTTDALRQLRLAAATRRSR
jgi:hypothetical protein